MGARGQTKAACTEAAAPSPPSSESGEPTVSFFLEDLPPELIEQVIHHLQGCSILAAAACRRVHAIVERMLTPLVFRHTPDVGPYLYTLAADNWGTLTGGGYRGGPSYALCSSPEGVHFFRRHLGSQISLLQQIAPAGGVALHHYALMGGGAGWSFLEAHDSKKLSPGACVLFDARFNAAAGRETKFEILGGAILRSSPNAEYDDHGDAWSWQLWRPGFEVMAPSDVRTGDGLWHRFAQARAFSIPARPAAHAHPLAPLLLRATDRQRGRLGRHVRERALPLYRARTPTGHPLQRLPARSRRA